jgi:deazaflavin-dependent oxidoreductase (nitroreductase family)
MHRRLAGLGSHPVSVWVIKHVVSPLDRLVVRVSRGRLPQPSGLVLPTVLMTTVGRRSGIERTVPLVFVRDGDSYVVANARPAGERRNPWVANLRDAGRARIRHRGSTIEVTARELDGDELERWWPELVGVWPAFAEHFAATGERSVFVLTPA